MATIHNCSQDLQEPLGHVILEYNIEPKLLEEDHRAYPCQQGAGHHQFVLGLGRLHSLDRYEALDKPAVLVDVGEQPEVDPEELEEDVQRLLDQVQHKDDLEQLVHEHLDGPCHVLGQPV